MLDPVCLPRQLSSASFSHFAWDPSHGWYLGVIARSWRRAAFPFFALLLVTVFSVWLCFCCSLRGKVISKTLQLYVNPAAHRSNSVAALGAWLRNPTGHSLVLPHCPIIQRFLAEFISAARTPASSDFPWNMWRRPGCDKRLGS